MQNIEILTNPINIEAIRNYFEFKLDKNDCMAVTNELQQLSNEVSGFNCGLKDGNLSYYNFLFQQSQLIKNFNQESEFLEWVIPLWSQQRGKIFATDKAVDEFYRELELLTLWRLLLNSLENNDFSVTDIRQMRRIIRRYGKMPVLWRYLCNLSGEDITTAYTF